MTGQTNENEALSTLVYTLVDKLDDCRNQLEKIDSKIAADQFHSVIRLKTHLMQLLKNLDTKKSLPKLNDISKWDKVSLWKAMNANLQQLSNDQITALVDEAITYLEQHISTTTTVSEKTNRFFESHFNITHDNNQQHLTEIREQLRDVKKYIAGEDVFKSDSSHAFVTKQEDNGKLFIYKINNNGEIINDALEEWQKKQTELSRENAAYTDFNNKITIDNRNAVDNTEIKALIDELVNQASHYSSTEEKEKLATWLSNNGGQDNNRFFDLLLNYKHFGDRVYGLGTNKIQKMNWQVENGKIYFVYNNNIMLLQDSENYKVIFKDETGKTISMKQLDYADRTKEQLKKDLPLMKLESKIELSIKNEKVKPKLVELNITVYSDKKELMPNVTTTMQPNIVTTSFKKTK